ncbi:hypothetical protein LguiA_033253 [Lonicera macranthoides]
MYAYVIEKRGIERGGAMERESAKVWSVMIALVVLFLLVQHGEAGAVYACWGGCYNECVLKIGSNTQLDAIPCYLSCFSKCAPSRPSATHYYCQLDGKKLGGCLGKCSKTCKPKKSP